MISWLWAIITFVNNLWSAFKSWQAMREANRKADQLAEVLARKKAEEDLKNAQNEDEFDNASDELHRH